MFVMHTLNFEMLYITIYMLLTIMLLNDRLRQRFEVNELSLERCKWIFSKSMG